MYENLIIMMNIFYTTIVSRYVSSHSKNKQYNVKCRVTRKVPNHAKVWRY